MYVANRHPDIGESVGVYKVLELIGRGGLGVVFKVERGGRFYAMKFLLTPKLGGRAKREISVLNHLDNPGVVRYVGSDYWPNPVTGYPYIVMEYVPGDTLEAFAFRTNPSARKGVRIILDVARTLGEVHSEGVFHRDLKPTNIVIRGAAERPVLIDFGLAALAGAACLTGASIPPATEEYRPPDPLRFEREHPSGSTHYEFGTTDELWALGVTFYWLLTDAMPFGERTDEGGIEALRERIRTQRPIPPHVVNPRVPIAVSRLCMKMLAASPADRFPNVPELCRALQDALSGAEDDRAWDVPLMDPHDPQVDTTAEDADLREPNEALRAYRQQGKRRPRRGLLRPVEASGPELEPDQDQIPTVDAPGAAARPDVAELPATAPAFQAPPGGLELPAPVVTRALPAWRRLGLVAALLTVAVGVLYLSASAWGPGASSPTSPAPGGTTLPAKFPMLPATDEAVTGREMASTWEPPEFIFKVGAAPLWAQPPASPTIAMSSTLPQTPTNEAQKPQTQRAGFRLGLKPLKVAAAVGLCTGPGCTATNNQVRPEPPPISCPEDWRETHKRFNVYAEEHFATVKGYKAEPGEAARVKDGPASLYVGHPDGVGYGSVGKLPDGTLLLGAWKLGDGRLFGTFTEAKVPGQGPLPVCLVAGLPIITQFKDERGNLFDCPPGLGVCLTPGSTPGNAKTPTSVGLQEPVGQP